MERKYKVSVVIPCYNGERYLKRAVNSLLNQTLKELEIIIVNDGSKDSSLAIAQDFENKYDNVIIYNKKNEGLFLARKSGVEVATGEYIGFLDVDDYVKETMYEAMYFAAKKHDADLVNANYISKIGPLQIKPVFPLKSGYYDEKRTKEEIVGGVLFNTELGTPVLSSAAWIKLIKNEIVKKTYKELTYPLKMSEDQYLTVALFKYVKTCQIIDDYLYYYVFHRHSIMTSYKPHLVDTFLYTHEVLYRDLSEDIPELKTQIEGHLCLDMCFALRNFGKHRASYSKHYELVKSLYDNPVIRNSIKEEYLKNLPASSRRVGRLLMNNKLKTLALHNFFVGLFNFIH